MNREIARPPHDFLKLIGTALLVVAVGLLITYIANRFGYGRYISIAAVGIVVMYRWWASALNVAFDRKPRPKSYGT